MSRRKRSGVEAGRRLFDQRHPTSTRDEQPDTGASSQSTGALVGGGNDRGQGRRARTARTTGTAAGRELHRERHGLGEED